MAAALAWLAVLPSPVGAQEDTANGVLLVAKPGMPDPRFRNTVILVTQTQDFQTVGVILNRPTGMKVRDVRPDAPAAYAEPLYYGGPLMDRVLIALFQSDRPPAAAAFHVLRDVYLSMHPAVVEPLIAAPPAKFRLYAGFSGWAPRQLEGEVGSDSWFMLPASEALVFRKDTSGMWEELSEQAMRKKAALY